MMGSATRMRLAEPVHLVGSIRRVEITELRQGIETSSGCFEAVDADEDVDVYDEHVPPLTVELAVATVEADR